MNIAAKMRDNYYRLLIAKIRAENECKQKEINVNILNIYQPNTPENNVNPLTIEKFNDLNTIEELVVNEEPVVNEPVVEESVVNEEPVVNEDPDDEFIEEPDE